MDAHALLYRSHFGFRAQRLETAGGEDTSISYGFLSTVLRLVEIQEPPTHFAVVMDHHGKTFRWAGWVPLPHPSRACECSAVMPHFCAPDNFSMRPCTLPLLWATAAWPPGTTDHDSHSLGAIGNAPSRDGTTTLGVLACFCNNLGCGTYTRASGPLLLDDMICHVDPTLSSLVLYRVITI